MPETENYRYDLQHSPSYAQLDVHLRPEQSILVEASAMAAMDANLQMKSRLKGGLLKGLGRALAGESLFINEFTAQRQQGTLHIAPAIPGDVRHYALDGQMGLIVQSGGFVACSPTIELETKFQGVKGFFSGESIFMLRASGRGDLWFSSYGGILEIPISGEYVIDTGYIVAFEDTLDYGVEMISGLSFRGLRTGLLGGEGLVCRLRGQGRAWIQARHLFNLLNFL
ncbi:MAG: TIGR00266 family protein, partial [Cyanobacteria bacterium J06641_5]